MSCQCQLLLEQAVESLETKLRGGTCSLGNRKPGVREHEMHRSELSLRWCCTKPVIRLELSAVEGTKGLWRDSQRHSLLFSQSGDGLAAGQTGGAEMLCERSSQIYPSVREEGQKSPILHSLSLGSQNLRAVSNLKCRFSGDRLSPKQNGAKKILHQRCMKTQHLDYMSRLPLTGFSSPFHLPSACSSNPFSPHDQYCTFPD